MVITTERSKAECIHRANLSLDGLAIGDAWGEMFAYRSGKARECVMNSTMPPKPWFHTDDTEMALAIVETIYRFDRVDQDALAYRFASRFHHDPYRGYGKMARIILEHILNGDHWQVASQRAFSGEGSMGNGAAMRVAPLGAYFAEDIATVVQEAKASAIITHSHPEGLAGAVAIAVAAAMSWRLRNKTKDIARVEIFKAVLEYTPQGKTYQGILTASNLSHTLSIKYAAKMLGNGSLVTAPDTVPYAIWCATRHLDSYVDALVETVSGGGDCDTNCAMVGGIVSLFSGYIPEEWLKAKEPFQLVL